jgi:hypothetical protein
MSIGTIWDAVAGIALAMPGRLLESYGPTATADLTSLLDRTSRSGLHGMHLAQRWRLATGTEIERLNREAASTLRMLRAAMFAVA